MKKTTRLGVVLGLVLVAGFVLLAKERAAPKDPQAGGTAQAVTPALSPADMPRLLELGSVSCIPCQMMAPILDGLRREFAGRLQVDFIDVREHQEVAEVLGVRTIPTQVFFDASGRELFRHTGFFPKEDIVAKWRELGVDLMPSSPQSAPEQDAA
jgi:thioredoxin 1